MPHSRIRLGVPRRRRPHRGSGGQSLAEFAIVLPILVLMFSALVDVSRAYETLVKLESATRDAAELAAMNATSAGNAATIAQGVVCAQFGHSASCSNPSISTTYTSQPSSAGGTPINPAVTVTVSSTTLFATLFPYPFVSGGGIDLSASTTYRVLQGR